MGLSKACLGRVLCLIVSCRLVVSLSSFMEIADLDALPANLLLGPFVVMLGFIWMTIVLVVVGSMTL